MNRQNSELAHPTSALATEAAAPQPHQAGSRDNSAGSRGKRLTQAHSLAVEQHARPSTGVGQVMRKLSPAKFTGGSSTHKPAAVTRNESVCTTATTVSSSSGYGSTTSSLLTVPGHPLGHASLSDPQLLFTRRSESPSISPNILRKTQQLLQSAPGMRSRHNVVTAGEIPGVAPASSSRLMHQASIDLGDPTACSCGLDNGAADMDRAFGAAAAIRSSGRFQLKKLRAKQATAAAEGCAWRPMVGKSLDDSSAKWANEDQSLELCLRGVKMECLSDVERSALQRIVLARLQKANLGVAISKPKDSSPSNSKRQKYVKRKAHTVNIVEKTKDHEAKSKQKVAATTQVFGVPLNLCIQNDLLHEPGEGEKSRVCKSLDLEDMESLRVKSVSSNRSSFTTSTDSSLGVAGQSSAGSRSSLNLHEMSTDGGSSRDASSRETSPRLHANSMENIIDSRRGLEKKTSPSELSTKQPSAHDLKLASSPTAGSPNKLKSSPADPHIPKVPKVVQDCCRFLESHGLHTIGLFRIAGSAKRCRQIRYEIDAGQGFPPALEEAPDFYPHDIATLLKEYFRDLPSPLLSKELYSAFIATARFDDEKRLELLRSLLLLLPVANLDTVTMLFRFLKQVSRNSYDTISDEGISKPGNKMNVHNLATVFGPTILRPSGTKSSQTALSDNDAVITVIESMLENCDNLFWVPKELQHAAYKDMLETDSEAVDHTLDRIYRAYRKSSQDATDEESHATIFYSTQEEFFPEQVTKEADGTTVIRTKQCTTHRIVYRVQRETDTVMESQSSPGETLPDRDTAVLDQKFPELTLFIDDTSGSDDTTTELIDPNRNKTGRVAARLGNLKWTGNGKQ